MTAPVEDFGPYRVHEPLGTGGVAVVHRAELRAPDGSRKPVALKRLLPQLRASAELVESFVREGQLAIHLRHPNIAQTFEVGRIGQTHFIAMELVPGPTLDQIMRHSHAVAGAIPLPVALGLVVQLCDALDYAHNLCDAAGQPLGIVHRDVSPANVIVSNTGIAKLVDFGIAKLRAGNDGESTGQGVIKGKMSYVAPEYMQHGQLDPRADVFAVGVIAHELMTSRRLFEGADDFETTARLLTMPIPPPSRWALEVPRDLDDIVLFALQRDPEQRWQSAQAMRNAIIGAAKGAVADPARIVDWVTWAFEQKAVRSDPKLAQVIETLDEPSTGVRRLSPEQQRALDALGNAPAVVPDPPPAEPALTSSQGHAPLTASQGHAPLTASQSHQALTASQSQQRRARIVDARPIPHRPRRPASVITPINAQPVTGEGEPRSHGGHFARYAFLVVLAAIAGVFATAYLLGIDLLP